MSSCAGLEIGSIRKTENFGLTLVTTIKEKERLAMIVREPEVFCISCVILQADVEVTFCFPMHKYYFLAYLTA